MRKIDFSMTFLYNLKVNKNKIGELYDSCGNSSLSLFKNIR